MEQDPRYDVAADIAKARTLPAPFYRNQSVYERLLDYAFRDSWQCIGHEQDPPHARWKPITLLPDSLDIPLVLGFDNDRQRLWSNVCTHRGHLLASTTSNRPLLRCRYHGRAFDADGKVADAPGFEGVDGFPCAEDQLPELPLSIWEGLLFTHAGNSGNSPWQSWIAPLQERLPQGVIGPWHPAPGFDAVYDVPAHWALYVDNYLEGFHIPFVHPALNKALDWSQYETELLPASSLQIGLAAEGQDAFPIPTDGPDAGKRVAAYYYHAFPNTMFNIYPWGLSLNVVEPIGLSACRVHFRRFLRHEGNMVASMDLDEVQREDEEVVLSVQQGIASTLYKSGRFSPEHEKAVHQFHRQLAACIGP